MLSIFLSCPLLIPGHVDVDGDAGSAVVFAHLFIPSLCLDLRPSSLSLALTLLLLGISSPAVLSRPSFIRALADRL